MSSVDRKSIERCTVAETLELELMRGALKYAEEAVCRGEAIYPKVHAPHLPSSCYSTSICGAAVDARLKSESPDEPLTSSSAPPRSGAVRAPLSELPTHNNIATERIFTKDSTSPLSPTLRPASVSVNPHPLTALANAPKVLKSVPSGDSNATSPEVQVNGDTRASIVDFALLPDGNSTSGKDVIDENRAIQIQFVAKVLVVGNAKCGKSSIISRYASNTFSSHYKTTIGADFVRKDVRVAPRSSGSAAHSPPLADVGVRVQLWDIAGQDRFQKFTRAYFSKARAVAIVCDISREGTIEAVCKWKREVDLWAASSGYLVDLECEKAGEPQDESDRPRIPIVLFANKADLLVNAAHAFSLGARMERLCHQLRFSGWWICSARTGEAIHEGFEQLLQDVVQQEQSRRLRDAESRQVGNSKPFRLSAPTTAATAGMAEEEQLDYAGRLMECC
jgi:small GTP-binding protein